MRKIKKTSFLLLSILVVGFAGYFILSKNSIIEKQVNRSSQVSLVQDRLEELSEMTTLEYHYQNVIVSRTDKNIALFGSNIGNYGEAIKLIDYSGYLKAGTDLSRLQVHYNEMTNALSVVIPKSQILDNVIETEKTRVEDIKGNIFSDYPTQIVFDEINLQKKKLEEEKISQGFLDEANQRITVLLTSFLKSNGYEKVVIEFE